MIKTKSILFVGVGGQGIILASKILTEGLVSFGFDVKMSEVHGMSQRGGSVTTQVRFGDRVYSPLIGKGEADILISFEKLEALRWIEYLKDDGTIIVNNHEIYSVPVLIGEQEYPKDIIYNIKNNIPKAVIVDAAKIAEDLGNIKAQNVVLLGALVKALNIDNINWEQIIKEQVPEKYYELNLKAFRAGINI